MASYWLGRAAARRAAAPNRSEYGTKPGQAALQLAVLLGRLRVGPQVVAEQQVLLPEVAGQGDHVDVVGVRHAEAEIAALGELALQLRDVLVAEVDEAGDGLAGPLDIGHADHDVDHRLRRQAGHCRAADVLDDDGALAKRRGDAVAFAFVPLRPAGVVGDDLDGLGDVGLRGLGLNRGQASINPARPGHR